jgi:2-polyprenyl-3-methyl-5-hydroxy-6-metoxy-1,4-benzoquinol methylase
MSYYGSDRREVLPFYPKRGFSHVLEVGCAEGKHGALLLAEGVAARVSGIEYEPKAASMAEAVLDTVHVGDAQDVLPQLPAERYEAAAALDVLEHLRDPWQALTDLRNVLQPGGWVIASIPNVRFVAVVLNLLVRGRFDYTDSGVLDRTHLRFFTRRSIEAMFSAAGFAEVRIVGLEHPNRRWWVRVFARLLGDLGYRQFIVIGRR